MQVDEAPNGGGGVQIVGGAGPDDFTVSFEEASETLTVQATARLAAGPGCLHATRPGPEHPIRLPSQVECPLDGPARWLMADLGPGDDRFLAKGSLVAVGFVRIAGGFGDDVIRGGPEDDLLQAGPGADRLYGGAGADGLVGGLPGPTYLYGGAGGDLLAAGGGCAGGALVGGSGRDDASFAETQAHPGRLIVSFPAHSAWIDAIPGCHRVHLSPTDEDMEGSFGPDVLIGNGRPNAMLGQPGKDIFIGNGGEDVIDARDGVKDISIQCGRGHPRVPAVPKTKHHKRVPPIPATGRPEGRALLDSIDPPPLQCAKEVHGHARPRPPRLTKRGTGGGELGGLLSFVTLWVTKDRGLGTEGWPRWRLGSTGWCRRGSWPSSVTYATRRRRPMGWDDCTGSIAGSTALGTRTSPGRGDAWRRCSRRTPLSPVIGRRPGSGESSRVGPGPCTSPARTRAGLAAHS